MSRYDSAVHLDVFKAGGWPRIHDAIVGMVRVELTPAAAGHMCDLGASTGLLTAQLDARGYDVFGIEADQAAVDAGTEYGTWPSPPVVLTATPDSLGDLERALAGVRTLVARRILPELDDHGVTPGLLSDVAAAAGVRGIVLQGRDHRATTRHRLGSVHAEVRALMDAGWVPVGAMGQCAYLVRG